MGQYISGTMCSDCPSYSNTTGVSQETECTCDAGRVTPSGAGTTTTDGCTGESISAVLVNYNIFSPFVLVCCGFFNSYCCIIYLFLLCLRSLVYLTYISVISFSIVSDFSLLWLFWAVVCSYILV